MAWGLSSRARTHRCPQAKGRGRRDPERTPRSRLPEGAAAPWPQRKVVLATRVHGVLSVLFSERHWESALLTLQPSSPPMGTRVCGALRGTASSVLAVRTRVHIVQSRLHGAVRAVSYGRFREFLRVIFLLGQFCLEGQTSEPRLDAALLGLDLLWTELCKPDRRGAELKTLAAVENPGPSRGRMVPVPRGSRGHWSARSLSTSCGRLSTAFPEKALLCPGLQLVPPPRTGQFP